MATCNITINGKKIKAESEKTVLENARAQGISIPTLCNHEALAPYGVCRLCVVEVEESGRKQIITSCNSPVRNGMKVRTHSTQLQKIRKTLIELLLARSPNALVVQKMARDLGVKSTPHPKQDELCILCGQCVRTCREIVGAEALSFVHKGSKRMVGVPFYRDSRECIGCGSCVFVCPTGVVKMHDVISDEQGKSERIMDKWETRLPLQECGSDGNTFATKRMLERFAQQYEVSEGFLEICSHCRHK